MDISQTELKEAEVHFGNLTRKWNPQMKPYIYQKSKKIYLLDWQKTISSCKKFSDYLQGIGREKIILFLSTKKQGREIVKEQASKCKMPYIVNKWKGGFLTNFVEIKKKVKELQNLTLFIQKNTFKNLIKKEQIAIQKKKDKLQKIYEGIINLEQRPDILFIIGLQREKTAWKEAKKIGIPIIAICNTDCNPQSVDYVIPGNDEKKKAINFFANWVADAIIKVKKSKNDNNLVKVL